MLPIYLDNPESMYRVISYSSNGKSVLLKDMIENKKVRIPVMELCAYPAEREVFVGILGIRKDKRNKRREDTDVYLFNSHVITGIGKLKEYEPYYKLLDVEQMKKDLEHKERVKVIDYL